MENSTDLFPIIYETVNAPGNRLRVKELCEIAGVSRSGYYNWIASFEHRAEKEEKDRADFELILQAYKKRGYSKGVKGIYMKLIHMDPPVIMNHKKIRRLMRKYHLSCPIRKGNPYRQLMRALQSSHVAENILKREFESYGPRVILLTDITYLPYNGKFAYLSTIIDAYTKEILSYKISKSLEEDFVLDTVEALIEDHGGELHTDVLLHSDQGVHYTCTSFIEILHSRKIRQSMSRKGNCWDNAVQETFFGHMKDYIKPLLKECSEYEDVVSVIDDYIDYYNKERYQWELAKLSPNEFYKFVITGEYPLDIPNKPEVPKVKKDPKELYMENVQT